MSEQKEIIHKSLKIMVVDDDDLVRKTMSSILTKHGFDTVITKDGVESISALKTNPVDIALLDYELPDMDGIELMKHLREISPTILTMIITGHATIERAVKAMQAGAWDYIMKPVTPGMLLEKIDRLEEFCYLRREYDFRRKVMQQEFEFSGIVGPSAAMQSVYESVLRAAESTLPVLISGETGVGKEYVAEAIHSNCKRKNKPFVIMDCTATPETLIESTLFGSTKGAFTGSVERKGLLEAADGGTLFLDEVGEIAVEIQPKLLRCLETKRFRPVGSTTEKTSDFRIICATNRDLLAETKVGKFRADLFYRISALQIVVPPLKERPSDIPVLANRFLESIADGYEMQECEFTPDAHQVLRSYDWPGNIRQLKFVVESAFFNARSSRIAPEHLSIGKRPQEEISESEPIVDFKTYRDEAILQIERNYIVSLLKRTDGDVRKAAAAAKMTRESLYRVMSRCGLSIKEYKENN